MRAITVMSIGVPSGSRTRVASDDEARRLINACRADFRALVTVALLTAAAMASWPL